MHIMAGWNDLLFKPPVEAAEAYASLIERAE